jgi:hypothetical protein
MNHIIYKLISPSNKVYIGQTKNTLEKRWDQHIKAWNRYNKSKSKNNTCRKLYEAFNKYPPSKWRYELICEIEKCKVDETEIFYISEYDSTNIGYNISKGGSGVRLEFLTEEHKQNISKSRKQYFETPDGISWKEELSKNYTGENNPRYGVSFKHSEENKKIISEKIKGVNKGKEPWNKGKDNVYSEETLLKMSENRKGKGLGNEPWNKGKTGFKQPQSQKYSVAKALSKKWIVTSPEGKVIEIENLRKFCSENDLDQGNLSRGTHKGWKAKKV